MHIFYESIICFTEYYHSVKKKLIYVQINMLKFRFNYLNQDNNFAKLTAT